MSEPDFNDDPFGESATEEVAAKIPAGGPVSGGRRQPIPSSKPLPSWPDTDAQDSGDGADGDIDYSDLESVNRDLLKLRVRMARIRRQMRNASRDAAEAKLNYMRAMRRALVQQSGGSAETRKAAAELLCEELEAEMIIRQQVADEYNTLFRAVRDDVENAKSVAYNLRAIASIS